MAKRKDQMNAAYKVMIAGDQPAKTKETNTPLGVVLTAEQIARLDEIVAELGINRHKVMQYAISEFIRRWDQGERPKTRTETKEVLDI